MIHLRHQNDNPLTGLSALGVNVCKQILNGLSAASNRSIVRSRFASLDRRALEDIGLTIAERDDLLLR
ncbi:MAG TPA: hypothetical protein VKS78_02125 [Roseiarcus sp.]|nr:hypothetical protein [Roseiarcus sp.]